MRKWLLPERLYVTAYPTQSWADMPNLKSFLAEWGLEPQTGVLFESDMNNVLTTQDASPAYLLQTSPMMYSAARMITLSPPQQHR